MFIELGHESVFSSYVVQGGLGEVPKEREIQYGICDNNAQIRILKNPMKPTIPGRYIIICEG